MVYRNNKKFCELQMDRTMELIEYNGHVYVEGEYVNKNSKLTVYCLTHECENTTTFTNYTRSKTGMPCCGNVSKSKILTNRVYSAETIDKMRNAALTREKRPSTGQNWRRSPEAREWEGKVQALWNRECAITGSKDDIIMHHFFSGARNNLDVDLRTKLLYHPLNGIIISRHHHAQFHNTYGYQRTTLTQFHQYVDSIYKLISSQAKSKNLEGSETRRDSSLAENAQRLEKLQKRLEEIKIGLAKDLPPEFAKLM